MVDMNETQDREQSQQSTGGPRVSTEQMRDVGRLRRSRSDRYVAGVAGGLGRHFDVDPTVIRVVLAVLTFFGGAGLLVYVAVWLLVPEDGEPKAPWDVRPDIQRALLLTAVVVALLIVFGTPFANGGWGWGFPFPLLVVGLLGFWIYTLVRRDKGSTPPPAPWGQATQTTTAQEGPAVPTETDTDSETRPLPSYADQQPPAWMPPIATYVPPPPKPRRTGVILFWPTVALIAIALGILGIFDVDNDVLPSAYVALAVAITAVMLLVGAFVGRPGGLIALGIVASIGLAGSTTVEAATDWQTGGESVTYTPTTTAAVSDVYSVPNGKIDLDLSGIADPAALDGRTIDLHLNAGEIDVEVPPGVNTVVNAELSFAGDVEVDGQDSNGFNPELHHTIASSIDPANAPTLTLEIAGRVGHVSVGRN
jgi:phage shock protein PspC (stress-responsive transcriptional regulator)